MDEVIPGLWIGGLTSALSIDYLTQAGITHIITCMKQRLPPPPTLLDGRQITPEHMHHVRLDDVEQAPILAHFTSCNQFIANVLQEAWVPEDESEPSSSGSDEKVLGDVDLLVQGRQRRNGKSGHWQTNGHGSILVHCQAGCSRSVAIAAAYLMHTREISAQDAIKMIQARRKGAQPNTGFMAQLELYEKVGFDVDMRHQAVRRYLMSKTDILNGDSFDDMLLSYYPSPYPSPGLSSSLKALSVAQEDTDSSEPSSSENKALVDASATASSINQKSEVRVTENAGRLPGGVESIKGHQNAQNRNLLPKPTFAGPKLRCRACRRELAALDHLIEHEPGKGQLAFEHRKRETGQAKYAADSKASASAPSPAFEQAFGATPSRQTPVAGAEDAPSPRTEVASPQAGPVKPAIQTGASLNARLPPHLAALRGAMRGPAPQAQAQPQAPQPSRSMMLHSPECSAYFVEPMAWMSALADGEVSGRLQCPAKKCGAKLGSWDWAGMQCGCGAWVTPAFALHRSKVDEV